MFQEILLDCIEVVLFCFVPNDTFTRQDLAHNFRKGISFSQCNMIQRHLLSAESYSLLRKESKMHNIFKNTTG